MTTKNESVSINQLLDDLAKSLYDTWPSPTTTAMEETKSGHLGLRENHTEKQTFIKKARKICYGTLLSFRVCSTNDDQAVFGRMSVFDRLFAKTFEKRLSLHRVDSVMSDNVDALFCLFDGLKKSTQFLGKESSDFESTLMFLLALADTGTVDNYPRSCTRLARQTLGDDKLSRLNLLQRVSGKHMYEQFPRHAFQPVHNFVPQTGLYECFDSKVFEQCPGFVSLTSKLLPHMFSSSLSNTVAPTLYGALSLPGLKDCWQLDVRLDIPELLEESPAPNLSVKPQRFPNISTQRSSSSSAVDEDEGFVETTETPSSACSFGRTIDNEDLWKALLGAEGYDLQSIKTRYRTWESHGSYDVPRDKPMLLEAGPKAVDEILVCLHREISLVHPDVCNLKSNIITSAELHLDAVGVLVGIPSTTFIYNEMTGSYSMTPVTISGLSVEALSGMLANFCECGRAYRRLDYACRSKKPCESLVQKALFNAIGCYLRHYQESVLDLRKNETGQLLNLLESTRKIRRQICFILRLCFLRLDDPVTMPRGIYLLRHLFDTIESMPGSGGSNDIDDRAVILSFFIAATEPYIQCVRSWVFEGRRLDPYNEFNVSVDGEFFQSRNEQFWKKSLRLNKTEDPLLGNFSNLVFICGKSLHLLRICCPQHQLFSLSSEAPTLEIAFSEERQMELMSEATRYDSTIKAEVQKEVLNREFKLLSQDNARKEQFHEAQMMAKLSMLNKKHENRRRQEQASVKKRHLMEQLQSQIALNLRAKKTVVSKVELAKIEPILDEASSTLDQPTSIDLVESETNVVTFLDSNMNPRIKEDVIECETEYVLDPNANPSVNEGVSVSECASDDDVVLRKNTKSNGDVKCDTDYLVRGCKRKQDRDSIDFDAGGVARRHHPSDSKSKGFKVPSSLSVRSASREQRGVLVEGSTFAVLRTRGRSAHGHSSDSTIQKLMYGNSSGLISGGHLSTVSHSRKKETYVKRELESDLTLPVPAFTNLRCEPYAAHFAEFDRPPMVDIFRSPICKSTKSSTRDDCVSSGDLFRLPLSATLQKCLVDPLRSRIAFVDSCLLEYFLITLKAKEHFSALRDYFCMQNGEFGQALCDPLFQRLSTTTDPSLLLNPVVLNPILSSALMFSSSTNPFADNLGFVVKFMPTKFNRNSPSALNCLELTYQVDWPFNILLTSSDLDRYKRIFSFILQVRRCSWSLGDVYSTLKELDSNNSMTASSHFRRIQFFRHEMLHFIRSLYEFVGVQAFQATWFNLQKRISTVRNLDELIKAHSTYLRHIYFRCLLHEKAVSVMKIVQDIFSVVLKFRSRLLSASWTYNVQAKFMEVDCFLELCELFDIFKKHSTFLYKVISKLVRRRYLMHLTGFLLSLNFNNYYSTLITSQCSPESSCLSLSPSTSFNEPYSMTM